MAQPKTNPIAVRMSSGLEAEIAAHVIATGRNRNLAITQLLKLGLETFNGLPKFVVKPGPKVGAIEVTSERDDEKQCVVTKVTITPAKPTKLKGASVARTKPDALTPHEGADGVYVGRPPVAYGQFAKGFAKGAKTGRDKWK